MKVKSMRKLNKLAPFLLVGSGCLVGVSYAVSSCANDGFEKIQFDSVAVREYID
jgi:hypothetical protein